MKDEEIIFSDKKGDRMELSSSVRKNFSSDEEALEYFVKVKKAIEEFMSQGFVSLTSLIKFASITMKSFTKSEILFGYSSADFLQIAFEKILIGKRKWTDKHSFKNWLYICVKSEILNTWKKHTQKGKLKSEEFDESDEFEHFENDEGIERTIDYSGIDDSASYQNGDLAEDEEEEQIYYENIPGSYEYENSEIDNAAHDVGTIVLNEALEELNYSPNEDNNTIDYLVLESFNNHKKWNVKQLASELKLTDDMVANSIRRIKRRIKRIGTKK